MIIDCHNDLMLKLHLYKKKFLKKLPEKSLNTKRYCAFFSFWASEYLNGFYFEELKEQKYLLYKYYGENIIQISTKETFEKFKNSKKKTGVIFNVEGGQILDDRPENVKRLKDEGIIKINITHSGNLSWAGSSDTPTKGLTSTGRDIINELNKHRIIIDLAHSSYQTMKDVLQISQHPTMYSHGGVYNFCKSERSIRDDIIKSISNFGGKIGVSFFPFHITTYQDQLVLKKELNLFNKKLKYFKSLDMSPYKKHALISDLYINHFPNLNNKIDSKILLKTIKHLINIAGDDAICIGSDIHGTPYSFFNINKTSDIHKIKKILLKNRFKESLIEKILYKNTASFLNNFLL